MFMLTLSVSLRRCRKHFASPALMNGGGAQPQFTMTNSSVNATHTNGSGADGNGSKAGSGAVPNQNAGIVLPAALRFAIVCLNLWMDT